MRRPVGQVAREGRHHVSAAAPDPEVEHRPVVAVAKYFGIRAESLVVAARTIADDGIGRMPRPIQQVGGQGQAGLFDAAVGRVVEVEEPARVLDQPGLVNAVLFPSPAVRILDGQDRSVLGPPPSQPVLAAGHALVARPQFVTALARVTAVKAPVLAVALFEQARRLDIIGLVQKRADHAAAVVEFVRGPKAHRQPRIRPADQVRAFGDERVVALAIKGDEAHVPLVPLAWQLVDARAVRTVEFLVAGDFWLGRDDVIGVVMPAAIRGGPLIHRLPSDVLVPGLVRGMQHRRRSPQPSCQNPGCIGPKVLVHCRGSLKVAITLRVMSRQKNSPSRVMSRQKQRTVISRTLLASPGRSLVPRPGRCGPVRPG